MKRWISFVLICFILLGLAACGKPENVGHQAGESKADAIVRVITANDLMQTLRDAGYDVQKQNGITAEDMDMENAASFAPLSFYKEADGVEKMGELYFMEFDNAEDAESAYNTIVSMFAGEGIPLRSVNTASGMKSTYTDDADPDFGEEYVISQLDKTVIFAIECWDIDSSGHYDHELNEILKSLGY